MRLGLNLNMKQKQDLVINHQIIQSINILQYGTNELLDYINMELERNPVLEKEEVVVNPYDEIDWEKFVRNLSHPKLQDYSKDNDNKDNSYLLSSAKETLKDALISQLHLLDLSKSEIDIGEVIIDFIDDNGYLSLSPKEIAASLNVDQVKVLQILQEIRTFEPSGVGGRDLKECLIIQLKNMKINDDTLYYLINNHLEDIAYHQYSKIIKKMNIDEKSLEKYITIIQSLNPKPGLKYYVKDPEYIVPEVMVNLINDEIVIHINETTVPTLKINEHYVKLLKSDVDEKTRKYIKSNLYAATMIVNSITQRKETIKKISSIIFNRQKDFFKRGGTALKPLTLKEVAQEINVHESTVSRAINNKYALTPLGVFPLKYFFPVGLHNTHGENVSVNEVKEIIKVLIKSENKKRPLSDQQLMNILKEKGYKISRRTVAKYRDELLIPSTRLRKEK